MRSAGMVAIEHVRMLSETVVGAGHPGLSVCPPGSVAYGKDAEIVRAIDRVDLSIDRVDLSVDRGEFVCLLGPSGRGKTTVLNAVEGFLMISSGTLTLKGRSIDRPGPDRAMVFQQPSLLPWRDVLHNVTCGLELADAAPRDGCTHGGTSLLRQDAVSIQV